MLTLGGLCLSDNFHRLVPASERLQSLQHGSSPGKQILKTGAVENTPDSNDSRFLSSFTASLFSVGFKPDSLEGKREIKGTELATGFIFVALRPSTLGVVDLQCA